MFRGRMKTKEDKYIFNTSVTAYLIFLIILSVGITFCVVRFGCTGITADDVEYDVERNNVTYEVTGVQNAEIDGGILYTISFKDTDGKAPAFESKMSALPTGLGIGSKYSAEWVSVTASFYKQAVVKNITAMEFTNVEITEQAINDAKKLVGETLVANSTDVVRPAGYVAILVASIISMILAILGVWFIDRKVANREPSYWEKMAEEHRTLENTVIDDNGEVQYRTEGEQIFHNTSIQQNNVDRPVNLGARVEDLSLADIHTKAKLEAKQRMANNGDINLNSEQFLTDRNLTDDNIWGNGKEAETPADTEPQPVNNNIFNDSAFTEPTGGKNVEVMAESNELSDAAAYATDTYENTSEPETDNTTCDNVFTGLGGTAESEENSADNEPNILNTETYEPDMGVSNNCQFREYVDGLSFAGTSVTNSYSTNWSKTEQYAHWATVNEAMWYKYSKDLFKPSKMVTAFVSDTERKGDTSETIVFATQFAGPLEMGVRAVDHKKVENPFSGAKRVVTPASNRVNISTTTASGVAAKRTVVNPFEKSNKE